MVCLVVVVVVIFVALTVVVLVVLDLELVLDLEVAFEAAPVLVLVDFWTPVAFALLVASDVGASVAPFTVAVGPAGGAR